jgi:hypothetical protein
MGGYQCFGGICNHHHQYTLWLRKLQLNSLCHENLKARHVRELHLVFQFYVLDIF